LKLNIQISTKSILENSENKKKLLVQTLKVQQNNFKKCSDSSEQASEVSFEIFHLLSKSLKPSTEGSFVKNHLFTCCIIKALLHKLCKNV
jgi:hypothetical protein